MTVKAQFEIHYQQFLNAQGETIQELPEFAQNNEYLLKMYRLMTLVRTFDNKAVALQRTGKMGTYAGVQGQEAISVAIGDAMAADDVFCPSYREYGTFLQRGVKMSEIFAYWGGDERGNDFSNKEDLPMCVPISTQCLHAAGIGVAMKHRKQTRAVVCVIGDGGTSKGDFYEAINLAGNWKLPVVFVINNNQWAISLPRSAQCGAETLAQKAIAAGFEGMQVDGNDVIALKNALDSALAKARHGDGPTLIEALTYRLCDHTTADDAKRYRDNEEVEQARGEQPLTRLGIYLRNQGVWSDADEEQLQAECTTNVEEAVQEYMAMSLQAPESMFDTLYATLPQPLEEQRNELLEDVNNG